MFRICLILCVSLISGITAKPWNKLTGEAFQDTILSIDGERKMSLGVEVEPPEDMDEIRYEIDPSMKIWKSMTGGGQFQKAEEDLDDLYHPSMKDLQDQIIDLDAVSAADIQAQPLKEDASMKYGQEAEEDKDDIYHPAFIQMDSEESEQGRNEVWGAEVRGAVNKPEEDEDDLYHRDDQSQSVKMEPLRPEMRSESQVRIHDEPEEDMDDLYHKDFLLPVTYVDYVRAASPIYLPSQKDYIEPEEDLDDLYHP